MLYIYLTHYMSSEKFHKYEKRVMTRKLSGVSEQNTPITKCDDKKHKKNLKSQNFAEILMTFKYATYLRDDTKSSTYEEKPIG